MRKFKGSRDFLANASPTVTQPSGEHGYDSQEGATSPPPAHGRMGLSADNVLLTLADLVKATPADLATQLKSNQNRVLAELEALDARELVTKIGQGKDGKTHLFALTPAGERLMRYRRMAKI